MSNQQIWTVALLLGFIIFLGQIVLARSAADSQVIDRLTLENIKLSKEVRSQSEELTYTLRLNNLVAGRLFELLRYTSGKVDGSLDSFQKLVSKIESDLADVKLRRDK